MITAYIITIMSISTLGVVQTIIRNNNVRKGGGEGGIDDVTVSILD